MYNQGTILGPLLFILYDNDLLTMMPDETTYSYADDTAVLTEGKILKVVEFKMNDYLDKIDDWLALNRLSLNVKKLFTSLSVITVIAFQKTLI